MDNKSYPKRIYYSLYVIQEPIWRQYLQLMQMRSAKPLPWSMLK